MLNRVFSTIFGSRNSRTIKRLQRRIAAINALSEETAKLGDEELKEKFAEFKERHQKGETLDQLLPEAFAVAREGGERFLGMRHFDVQLMGGLVLYEGNIAEMKTGEGKTLVATLPIYLRAIQGGGVHLITVNDYLAKRDAEWMGKLYRGLGMEVGVTYSGQSAEEKRAAYLADVTYGTNNEFGFDYLRDNLALRSGNKMQRNLNFAIVDEVDSILIDEARTPLIISGPREDSVELYQKINRLIPPLERQIQLEDGTVTQEGDFILDEKMRSVEITDIGHDKLEKEVIKIGILEPNNSLYELESIHLLHHLQAGLKAHFLHKRNVSYLVQNDRVVIVDEHTGRALPGRRWSEGIHQAVEAKEGLEVQQENQTLASTTFQNYFRLYDTLSGMTGTADTEAYEFQEIYNLEVVVVPTHKDMIRDDMNDTVYMTRQEKFLAIMKDIEECRKKETPVLIGTASVESSELLSEALKKSNIPHNVLNAKNHSREADIIAEAGRPGAITIATNMAGRGTDIMLGGNLEKQLEELAEDASEEKKKEITKKWQEEHDLVLKQGGLHVIGSERHESRRIDNQLRGRSGRQGDPGSSHFYLSLDDDLLRLFMPEKVINMMRSLGLPEGEPITHSMITNAIERAQRKVEGRNFDIRKQLLEYDDVANNQRMVIYEQRNEIMNVENISEAVKANIEEQTGDIIFAAEDEIKLSPEQETGNVIDKLVEDLRRGFSYSLDKNRVNPQEMEALADELSTEIYQRYTDKFSNFDEGLRHDLEKQIMLQVLDGLWRDHIQTMDYLRQGIHLRGYAQRNPKEEYKKESYQMFDRLLTRIKQETARILCNLQINEPRQYAEAGPGDKPVQDQTNYRTQHKEMDNFGATSDPDTMPRGLEDRVPPQPTSSPGETIVRKGEKIGRNQPCPCGSGKKYKHCHGKEV